MTAEQLAAHLSGRGYNVTRRSGEYWIPCPAHDDPNPSCSFKDGAKGVLLHCRAGCDTRAILSELGVAYRELFYDDDGAAPERPDPDRKPLPTEAELSADVDRLSRDGATLQRLAEWRGWSDPDRLRKFGVGQSARGRVTFPARNAEGALVGYTEYDPNPERKGPKSISQGTREMFPPPEFVPGETLYVTEGEADAVLALMLGLNAVGIPGVPYWVGERGRLAAQRMSNRRQVFLIPDCDGPGREWVQRAAQDLLALGVDARVLELNAANEDGYDLTDLVSDGSPDAARRFVESLSRNSPRLSLKTGHASESAGWPVAMAEEAFMGLMDRITRDMDPITEADRAAVLLQLLTAFGSIVGRTPYMLLDGARHYPVLYVCIVGRSSKSRKGTSWARVAEVMYPADRTWFEERVVGGLSSGEGLVWEVRDPVYERVRRDGKRDDDSLGEIEDDDDRYVKRVVDPGVEDKRLLVVESEFAQALRVMRREGNTLSMNLRNLWDRGTGGGMTKNSRTRVINGHVSIIGHITVEELKREMGLIDLYNGFANRFLFVCAKRSKLLPGGGALDDLTLMGYAHELATAAQWAREAGRVTFDFDAEQIWSRAYTGELAVEHPGAYGAVTARGEPMVARLSMLYALLDGSAIIRPKHLRAGLAVWRYCDASARFLFSPDFKMDRDTERMRDVLTAGPVEGMTRTQINDALRGHWKSERIVTALTALRDAGLATVTTEPSGGIRPVERWRLT
jgi:hypothetical protein